VIEPGKPEFGTLDAAEKADATEFGRVEATDVGQAVVAEPTEFGRQPLLVDAQPGGGEDVRPHSAGVDATAPVVAVAAEELLRRRR